MAAVRPDWMINPNDWEITFYDGFTDPMLDMTKWNTGLPWGSANNAANGESQMYAGEAVSQRNGKLEIHAVKPTVPVEHWTHDFFSYISGMVTTVGKYQFKYGYVEARIKMPQGKGIWPAFWLLPGDPYGTWPPEIDIVEFHGDKLKKVFMSYHYDPGSGPEHIANELNGKDFSLNYYTFGMNWQPDKIEWFINNKRVFSTTQSISTHEMYILINIAVGGYWPGYPDDTTPFPQKMLIDWVRVRRRKDNYQ